MREFDIHVKVVEYDNKKQLPLEDQQLLTAAEQATSSSYAPYSQFNVGAAVLLENGEIVRGSNQENAAYPSGLCAERVAMFYANAQYPNVRVKAIAVSSGIGGAINEKPVYPCGSCRQSLLESEARQSNPIRVIMGGLNQVRVVDGVTSLLPLSFDLDEYKQKSN